MKEIQKIRKGKRVPDPKEVKGGLNNSHRRKREGQERSRSKEGSLDVHVGGCKKDNKRKKLTKEIKRLNEEVNRLKKGNWRE